MSKTVVRNAVASSFLATLKPAPAAPEIGKLARTAADLERLKQSAREEGYAAGSATGYAEGYASGHAEGVQAGYEEAAGIRRRELDSLLGTLSQSVDEAMQRWYEASEAPLAQLSVSVATRILATELSLDPSRIMLMVKEAVAEVTHATSARIRLNPIDAGILEEHKEDLIAASGSLRDLTIVEDSSIPGGCVIESDGGIVDARIDEKIHEILERIRTRLRVEG